jgi:hypothetical protein
MSETSLPANKPLPGFWRVFFRWLGITGVFFFVLFSAAAMSNDVKNRPIAEGVLFGCYIIFGPLISTIAGLCRRREGPRRPFWPAFFRGWGYAAIPIGCLTGAALILTDGAPLAVLFVGVGWLLLVGPIVGAFVGLCRR